MKLRAAQLGLIVLGACAAAGTAVGETIVIDDQVMLKQSGVSTPARGMSMDAVEARFGAPASRHHAVGQPPITRWDYGSFSVFFEHSLVIHSVAIGG